MKYFTPELWLQTQSGVDPQTFLKAYETWERNMDAYEEQLRRIIPPDRRYQDLRGYVRAESLHDGRILASWLPTKRRLCLLVQPDAPDDCLVTLEYSLAGAPVVLPDVLPKEFQTTQLRWMYDELDVVAETQDAEERVFTHNILLGNGCELIIRFTRLKMSRCQPLLPGPQPAIVQALPALSQPA